MENKLRKRAEAYHNNNKEVAYRELSHRCIVMGEAEVVVDDLLVDPGYSGGGHRIPCLHQHRL